MIELADMSRDRSQSVKIQNIFVDALYCAVDNHFELLNVQLVSQVKTLNQNTCVLLIRRN